MKTRNKKREELRALWLEEERNSRSLRFEMDAPNLYSQEEWNNLKAQYDKSKERQKSWKAALTEHDLESLRLHPGLDK